MSKFISEDDIESFDIWMQYQGINSTSLSADDLKMWKDSHTDAVKRAKKKPQSWHYVNPSDAVWREFLCRCG
jgi:hypothetical protein